MSRSAPDFCGWITNPGSVAASVVETVMQAMSCLRGSRQARQA